MPNPVEQAGSFLAQAASLNQSILGSQPYPSDSKDQTPRALSSRGMQRSAPSFESGPRVSDEENYEPFIRERLEQSATPHIELQQGREKASGSMQSKRQKSQMEFTRFGASTGGVEMKLGVTTIPIKTCGAGGKN